jgi:pilus assembly protein Flp/PilA
MDKMRQALTNFLVEEDATTSVEYAVMLALIIVVCIGSVTVLAQGTAQSFDTSSDAIAGAFGN